MEYQKINTLFKRDNNNIIIPDQYSLPEFEYLQNNKFECTEKIDGMNIRIEINSDNVHYSVGTPSVEFKGRTDRAVLPVKLLEKLNELFPKEKLLEVFNYSNESITLYGEGYGHKIQAAGNSYLKDSVDFILFDIRIGNFWLNRDKCEEIAKSLGIKIVPVVGYMTIPDAIEFVKHGFKSLIAEDKNLNAEGLVLRTLYGLKSRNGERIILKIKTKDFIDLQHKYGTMNKRNIVKQMAKCNSDIKRNIMETKIYAMNENSLKDNELVETLTDEEFKQISAIDGWQPLSIKELISRWNYDAMFLPSPDNTYIRAISE